MCVRDNDSFIFLRAAAASGTPFQSATFAAPAAAPGAAPEFYGAPAPASFACCAAVVAGTAAAYADAAPRHAAPLCVAHHF